MAFGFNLELVLNQDSAETAGAYIGQNLFGQFRVKSPWQLVGASGNITFVAGGRRWQAAIGPRNDDEATSRVQLGLNLHVAESRFPQADEVLQTMQQSWRQAHDFVNYFDARS